MIGNSAKVNINVSQPLRHDQARVITDAVGASGGSFTADFTDQAKAVLDCSAVKVTGGKRA